MIDHLSLFARSTLEHSARYDPITWLSRMHGMPLHLLTVPLCSLHHIALPMSDPHPRCDPLSLSSSHQVVTPCNLSSVLTLDTLITRSQCRYDTLHVPLSVLQPRCYNLGATATTTTLMIRTDYADTTASGSSATFTDGDGMCLSWNNLLFCGAT